MTLKRIQTFEHVPNDVLSLLRSNLPFESECSNFVADVIVRWRFIMLENGVGPQKLFVLNLNRKKTVRNPSILIIKKEEIGWKAGGYFNVVLTGRMTLYWVHCC